MNEQARHVRRYTNISDRDKFEQDAARTLAAIENVLTASAQEGWSAVDLRNGIRWALGFVEEYR